MDQIDELNSLCADLTDGKISEAEFRTAAMDRFGYDRSEVASVMKRLRRQRPDEASALRETVTKAAMQALSRRPGRRSNRNPLYRCPSAADAAWAHLYGTARAFVEWATDQNIALAFGGMDERPDSQAANVRTIKAAFTLLGAISDAAAARLAERERTNAPLAK